jgi:hypothetical protein
MRRFVIQVDGVTLGEGVEFSSGACVAWIHPEPAYVGYFSSLEAVEGRHCTGGNATLVLLD